MNTAPSHSAKAALISLEAAAASARGGFACLFSTSDEFEADIVRERREQGAYGPPQQSRVRHPLRWLALTALFATIFVIAFI